ncbi:hypothetical protein TWF106_010679 [Orbilia oligospora]|uniref:BZIP domain-containing protein n=1 Tax=Orbilia oligospora TaxID=2813651 RepID=A0A7C8UCL9_ORBOL|nr:hypothetical protein TWF106_010679 [Orbilia oligospora]
MSDIPSKQERIRENKRRHRARKKEYVEELERKLRDYQQQGVQAAPETQVAALRVVEQNIRPRELLRRIGVDDCTIQAWLQGRSHGFTEDMLAGRRNRTKMLWKLVKTLTQDLNIVSSGDMTCVYTFGLKIARIIYEVTCGLIRPSHQDALQNNPPSILPVTFRANL